ncbi:MAG TPA: mechanosensitive ion channel family protein [Burkholderiales bacterium]|nr:mechanosensitive ion channel family protein [Burkholderiales bacterium]
MKGWGEFLQAHGATDFAIAIAVALGVWVAFGVAKHFGGRALAHFARRTAARWDDIIAEAVQATNLLLLLPVALYAGSLVLELPARLGRVVELAALMVLMLQAGLWVNRFIGHWAEYKIESSRAHEPQGATALGLIAFAARVAAWSFLLLLALDQLGFDITALVAGLGIGGVAVALAMQNILGDLFASLSIILDKPFVVGDFVVVDDLRGTVERIGIKTTRLRSLDGELLVFSNADLLKSRVRNFQRMMERRVLFTVGVTYQTPPEQLRRIPQWLREAVEAQPRTRFDRAHFKEYGDSALVFEIVYYILDRDYNLFMDVQQAVNLSIFERFAREGVEFAYPTHMVHLKQEPAAQPA